MLVACLSCARHGAERLLLEQFFNASRLRDLTALQKIATVVFEPLEQGTITDFTIANVVDEEASKQVTVTASVRLPSGQTAARTVSLVLQRGDRVTTAQWIVTGFVVR